MRNLPTELVLLKIAEGLQTLVADKNLSNVIKDAYALSSAEQKKAEEARDIIARADEIRADFKKREDALANIDERIAIAESLEKSNEDIAKSLEKKRSDLAVEERKNIADASINQIEKDRLDSLQQFLDERASALADSEAENNALKADLKRRANILKAQTADL